MDIRTGSMEANHCIGKVRIETHPRSQTKWHVGKKSHAERSQGGDCSCRSDKISSDFFDAEQVFCVVDTSEFIGTWFWANTRPAAIRSDGC
jgi:hypothetical protein